jgi:hypothetical protein
MILSIYSELPKFAESFKVLVLLKYQVAVY